MSQVLSRVVSKGWGSEYIWADEPEYCGKLLRFNKGAKFSMHFHMHKKETWFVLQGSVSINYIDTANAKMLSKVLCAGDSWLNLPGQPHQVMAHSEAVIIEVSTKDSVEDNYRVSPGDSQNANSN